MPDYALIALSPAWIGSNKYIQKEKNKALLLHQYLTKLGYEIRFLVPNVKGTPFDSEECNKANFLTAMKYIRSNADPGSNVIYYISDSPRQVIKRLPKSFKDLVDLLEGKTFSSDEVINVLETISRIITSNHGEKYILKDFCPDIVNMNPDGDLISVPLKQLIGFLEEVNDDKSEFQDVNSIFDLIDLFNKSTNYKKPKLDWNKDNDLEKLLNIKSNEDKVTLEIPRRYLSIICDIIMNHNEPLYINIEFFIRLLRQLYIHYLFQSELGYLQLSEHFDPDKILYFSEIEYELDQTKNNTMMIFGSGIRSNIISEQFSRSDRLTIGSGMTNVKKGIDNLNIANGLVRASYYNLKTYDKDMQVKFGKIIDPIKAYSLEIIRLAKIGALKDQNPVIFYDPAYIKSKGLEPVIPGKRAGASAPSYDPRIGAFIPYGPPPTPLPPIGTGGGSSGGGYVQPTVNNPP